MQMNQNMMGGYTSPAAVTTDLIQQVLIRTQPRARSILVSSDLFFFVYALNFPSLSLSDPGSLSPFVFALFFFFGNRLLVKSYQTLYVSNISLFRIFLPLSPVSFPIPCFLRFCSALVLHF